MTQTLHVLQSLWAMESLLGVEEERSLEDNVVLIKAAGFDGFGALWAEDAMAKASSALARAEGLVLEGLCLPASMDEVKTALERAERFGLHHLNLQLQMRPRGFADAVAILEKVVALGRQASFPVYVETHRGRLTNDLLVTLDLLDAVPETRLLADLSHYVVAREIELPVSPELEAQMATVLDHAWAFHGRVAGSGQVQLPLSFEQHQPWIDQFAAWWQAGFRSWQRRAPADGELTFVCELGPRPYAISGADGQDLTDRWEEAKTMLAQVRAIWASTLS